MYFQRPGKRPDPDTAVGSKRLLSRYAVVACLLILGGWCLVRGTMPILSHWPYSYTEPVRAQVVDSRFEPVAGWQGLFRARPIFKYRYLHHGELFLSSSYHPAGKRAEAVRRYRPGIVIDVFVDPDHSTRAMVQPGVTTRDLVTPVIGSTLLVLGCTLIARK